MLASDGVKVAILLCAGLVLVPAAARAGNGTKPRIPVDWTGAACMTIVDRSLDPVLHLEYAVQQEDIDITDDEVTDSRTHQFFSFCRARDSQTFLPRWITQDDIDRALAKGIAPDDIDPEDILESSMEWASCWERITEDDDRRPISFDAAAQGVDWDTSSLAAGTYIVEAYTWEPPLNIWSPRGGVVKVVDTPAIEESGPALAVSSAEIIINKNQTASIEGCVSGMEGSTVTAYWALAAPSIDWVPFLEDEPVSGEAFAIEFTPPEEVAGESVLIRVDVDDPMGRSYTNYMRDLLVVLGTDGPGPCDDGSSFIGGAGCEEETGGGSAGGDASGTGATGGDGESSGGPSQNGSGGSRGGDGCSCRAIAADRNDLDGLLILLLLWGGRRRAKSLGNVR